MTLTGSGGGAQSPYTLSLANRDGGKRIRSETAKKGMSGERSMKSWEVRRGYRCSSKAVRRPRACSSDGGTCGGTGTDASSGDTHSPGPGPSCVPPSAGASLLPAWFQVLLMLRLPPPPCPLSLHAHLQLGPGTVHERQEALSSLPLCRKHQLLEVFRWHVQVCLGTGGHGGYGLTGQGSPSPPTQPAPICYLH